MRAVETGTIASLDAIKSPDAKFEIGSQVMLNSGGPIMTVRSSTKNAVKVDWFDAAEELCDASFDPRMVQAHTD